MTRITCLLLFISLLAAQAAPTPPPDKLLASDTLGMITVTDYAAGGTEWQNSPGGLLWADPLLKPFRDKLITKLKTDLLAPLEKEFGVKFADYAGLAQGQLTLAATRNGWEGQPGRTPGFILVMDSKDKAASLQEALGGLKKKWVDSGKTLRPEKIRDVEFNTFIFSSDDFSKTLDKVFPDPNEGYESDRPPKKKKAPRKMEWLVGQSGSLLIVGSSAKDIEKVLTRQAGGAVPSLAENGTFAPAYTALFRNSLCYGWVDLKAIWEIVSKAASATPAAASKVNPEKVLSALGLSSMKYLAFNAQQQPDGATINLQLSVPEASRRGLFRILGFEAKDASPPPFVPADAVKFTRWRLNLAKGWGALESVLAEVSPEASGGIKALLSIAGKDKDPNFDLRKNLIDNLGDDVMWYRKAPRKPTIEDLNSPPTLFLVSSPRPEQVASAVQAIFTLLPQRPSKAKEREFLGRKIYTMTTSTVRNGQRVDRSVSYAASGGYVAISADTAMLEEYVRNTTSKSLRDLPGLAEAAQKAGGMNTGLFSFENAAETARAQLDIVKKESGTLASLLSASSLVERLGIGENSSLKDWVDFSLLPSFDQISKYFYLKVWTGTMNADGVRLSMFSPTSPKLRK